MSPETIGRLLGVTAEARLAAKAWSIIPYRATKEQMMEQARERHKGREFERKRAKGARPREQSLTRTKPWEKLGISRPTWYRQSKPNVPEEIAPAVKEIEIPADRILH